MAALFSKKPEAPARPGLPSQKDLFLRSLYPGNHVDVVITPDDNVDVAEIRPSMIHDITRERQLILAQTHPPILPSQTGLPLEVTFLCQIIDPEGRPKQLRTSYHTQVASIIPNYRISATQTEAAIVVPLPARLEIASLRLYYRVEPQKDLSMRAYWSAEALSNEINSAIDKFARILRREFWLREKHPRRMVQDLQFGLQELVADVYAKTENVKQAYVQDISEGGAKLVHDRQIKFEPGEIQKLTLLWGEELWEVNVKIVRSGELGPEPHPSRIFTSVQFLDLSQPDRLKLSKLIQEMMRKELAARAADR